MSMPPDRISLGKAGEDYACRELERQGYEILARRFRTRLGEIDIVARHGDTLVFAWTDSGEGTSQVRTATTSLATLASR